MKYSDDVVLLIIGTMLICAGLVLSSCATTPQDPSPTIEVIRPERRIPETCVEVEPEVDAMRYWCSSDEITVSRQEQACGMVETYENECL